MQRGYAIDRLPERFQAGPKSRVLAEYISRKYGSHGFKTAKYIEYNPEYTPEGTGQGSTRYRFVENASDGLRFVGNASDIIRMRHTGYYVDNFQGEVVHGVVYQLPADRDGTGMYVPGVDDPWNDDSACLDFTSITGDKEDAARFADRMAEIWAEHAREYQAKEDAEQRIADITDEIKELYQQFRRIAREIRANCDALKGVSVVRELVRDKWLETKEEIRKLRREQRNIEEHGIQY